MDIDIHGYTDDQALKRAFDGESRTGETDTIDSLTNVAIKQWMDQNRLKMNISKTEFIIFGSRQQLVKFKTSSIDINNSQIKRSESIWYLGADLGEKLTLRTMINRKCRTAMGNLQRLKLIRKSLSLSPATTVALGLVVAHLDYANALYAALPAIEIKKLLRIQNMTAKIITGADKYDSSTTALKALHWFPVHLRIEYNIATLVVRSLHDLAPPYLQELVTITKTRRTGLRSQARTNILDVPFTRRSTFADHAFSVVGPRTWNLLLDNLPSQTDYKFKNVLKTHIFTRF